MRADLNALADYLLERREHVLAAWRGAVDADPQLSTPSRLTRREFNDHIPAVLDALAATLRRAAHDPEQVVDTEADAAHGIHRWQQGYFLTEVLREWAHLNARLVELIDEFAQTHAAASPAAMSAARTALSRFFGEALTDSVSQFFQLKQLEARGQLRDLEAAVSRFSALDRDRGRLLREATHDLRGSVSVAATATAALRRPELEDGDRQAVLGALERSLDELRVLLTDLMDLARLEAGQDPRRLEEFDAGQALFGLCEELQAMARHQQLTLTAAGPRPFRVESDPAKVRRIAQNLLLNALSYARQGEVRLSWGARDAQRWWLQVEDEGPGVAAASAQPLVAGLHEATRIAADAAEPSAPPSLSLSSSGPAHGEGIGLSIVKRLCELLDAGLEARIDPALGTQFRVTFPQRYSV